MAASAIGVDRFRVTVRLLAGVTAIGCLLLTSTPSRADVVIPVGALAILNSGGLDLGCTDLIVAGTLQSNSAPISNVRNLIILGGGLLDAGSSTISVGGNWSNSGTFAAGMSQVSFNDSCGVNPASIAGNNTFYSVSFISSIGKTWQFMSGSTQTVQNVFNVQGTPGNPVHLTSTVAGQPAGIVINGTQTVANLTTTDITFGAAPPPAFVAPIPTLSPFGMIVLFLLLSALIVGTSSRRLSQKSTRGNQL